MGYTVSLETNTKVKRGDIKGYLYHNVRDIIDKDLNHSNKDIDTSKTEHNITMVNDGNGEFKTCKKYDEVEDYIERRLSMVDTSKRKLRFDAVLMRGIVMQLDPDYVSSHTEEEIMKYNQVMIDWARDTFGSENIPYYSIHNDETHSHIHLGFIPLTEDRRLSQTDWFKNRASLRDMHDNLRDYLRNEGYDATRERVTGTRKRLSVDEYKAYKDAEKKIEKMNERERQLAEKEADFNKKKEEFEEQKEKHESWASELTVRIKRYNNDAKKLKTREKAVKEREDAIKEKEENLEINYDIQIRNMTLTKNDYINEIKEREQKMKEEYEKQTEELEDLLRYVDERKQEYSMRYKVSKISDVSLFQIKGALLKKYNYKTTASIMDTIKENALTEADKERFKEKERFDNAYENKYVKHNDSLFQRKRRPTLLQPIYEENTDDLDFEL